MWPRQADKKQNKEMKTMQERRKLKAARGEGTYTQWDALSQWIGKRTRYVADETGNWTDTEHWTMMKDKLYQYQQAHGEQPLLKTWVNNAYFDAEGRAVRDEKGNTRYGHYNAPTMRADGLPQKPSLWYLERMENFIKVLKPIMRTVQYNGAVVFGSTVQSPNTDGHIRKFVVTKEDVKDVEDFVTSTSSRVLYHPSGEKKKIPTINVSLHKAKLVLPKGITYSVKLTPAHAEDFFAWADGASKSIKGMKVAAQTQKTLNDIEYFTTNITASMKNYISLRSRVVTGKFELASKILEHEDTLAKGRVVADAIIAFKGLDMTVEEIENFYKMPRSERSSSVDNELISETYNKISKWSFNLKWNCPQRAHDNLVRDLLNCKKLIIENANKIKRLAPLGGEAKINEAVASKDNLNGCMTVEEFFAVHDDVVGDEE